MFCWHGWVAYGVFGLPSECILQTLDFGVLHVVSFGDILSIFGRFPYSHVLSNFSTNYSLPEQARLV